MRQNGEGEMIRQSVTERKNNGFKCSHCNGWVPLSELIGTSNRNHCPSCLWSKHVDFEKPGDRKSVCRAGMKPIGLTFKHEGLDRYNKLKQGEIMLIHQCSNTECNKISINRIAGDDNSEAILNVFQTSKNLDPLIREKLKEQDIELLNEKDEEQIRVQLFGKTQ